jgi:hypothetical protein
LTTCKGYWLQRVAARTLHRARGAPTPDQEAPMFDADPTDAEERDPGALALDRADRYHRSALEAIQVVETWPAPQRHTRQYEHRWCEAMGYVVEARHWLEAALVETTAPKEVLALRLLFTELDELAAALDALHGPVPTLAWDGTYAPAFGGGGAYS